jgi:dipeptidyl aminopeptidase/acylaminoacyl peptidase
MKRFLLRAGLILAAAWVCVITGLSWIYTQNLLYPPCPASASARPGFESVSLTTTDGLTLQGWWRASQNGAVILLLGGLGSNRDAMLAEAELLASHGYGVLTLDYRPCAGAMATVGYREIAELQAMRDFALLQPGSEWLGVLGFSVGGATAIRGAARMPELQAVVAEGNYANFYDELTAAPAAPLSVQWQAQHLVRLFFHLRTGINPRQISPVDDLPRLSPRPVLLIHGEKEAQRTRAQQQLQAARAGSQAAASLWVVPGAGHGGYRQAQPEEYDARILAFFDQAR